MLSGTFICFFIVFRKHSERDSLISCAIFNNIAFLGIPIINSLFKENMTAESSLVSSFYLLFFFTIGISFLEYSEMKKITISLMIKRCFSNPLLLAVLVGITFQAFNIKNPTYLEITISGIAKVSTPVVLIALGIFLGSVRTEHIQWKTILSFTFYTLIIAPLLLYGVCQITTINSPISVLESAMPVAFTPFALTERYQKLNRRIIAELIFVSTAFCLITIPIWFNLLQ